MGAWVSPYYVKKMKKMKEMEENGVGHERGEERCVSLGILLRRERIGDIYNRGS